MTAKALQQEAIARQLSSLPLAGIDLASSPDKSVAYVVELSDGRARLIFQTTCFGICSSKKFAEEVLHNLQKNHILP